jgi:hypothetical protein
VNSHTCAENIKKYDNMIISTKKDYYKSSARKLPLEKIRKTKTERNKRVTKTEKKHCFTKQDNHNYTSSYI